MGREVICGVYKITNRLDGEFYIGASKDIYDRFDTHRYSINDDRIKTLFKYKLLEVGVDNFNYEVLEITSLEDRFKIELDYIKNLKPAYNKSLLLSSIHLYGRPVRRINPITGEIKEYPSIKAVEAEGFTSCSVQKCMAGHFKTYANFLWQATDGSTPPIEELTSRNKIFYPVFGTSIIDGSIIHIDNWHDCLSQSFVYSNIRGCCKGIRGRRTHNGYTWKYADEERQKEAEKSHQPTIEENANKIIARTCLKTGEVRIYASQKEVENDGFSPIRSVYDVCRGKRANFSGYTWRYLNEEDKDRYRPFKPERKETKPIRQLNLDGTHFAVHKNYRLLKRIDFDISKILDCCNKIEPSGIYNDSIWEFYNEADRAEVENN